MPFLFKLFFGAMVRWAVTIVAGYLIAKGVLTEHEGGLLVAGLIMALPPVLWSLWQKYRSRLSFLTALEMPKGATSADVKDTLRNITTTEKLALVSEK